MFHVASLATPCPPVPPWSSAGAHARGRCAQCSAPRAAAQGLGAAGAGCGAGGGTSADASRGGVRGPSGWVAGKKTSSQKCCFI